MKLLKKPVFAWFLSALIIISATLISSNIRLQQASDEVSELFLYGYVNEDGLFDKLKSFVSSSELFLEYARTVNPDFNYSKVENNIGNLKNLNALCSYGGVKHLRQIGADVMFIEYSELRSDILSLIEILTGGENDSVTDPILSKRIKEIEDIIYSLEDPYYNDAVRSYYKKYGKLFSSFISDIAGVYSPQYFR